MKLQKARLHSGGDGEVGLQAQNCLLDLVTGIWRNLEAPGKGVVQGSLAKI